MWMLVLLVLVLTVVPHLTLLILLRMLNVLMLVMERMRHELRGRISHRLHLNLRLLIAYTPPRTRRDKRMHSLILTSTAALEGEREGDVSPIQPRFPTRTERDARIAELEDVRLYSFPFSA